MADNNLDPALYGGSINVTASRYPRWERQGTVSRFLLEPDRSFYEIEEMELIGGSIFVAFASGTTDLVGQFESEQNAKQACARDFTERQRAGTLSGAGEHRTLFKAR